MRTVTTLHALAHELAAASGHVPMTAKRYLQSQRVSKRSQRDFERAVRTPGFGAVDIRTVGDDPGILGQYTREVAAGPEAVAMSRETEETIDHLLGRLNSIHARVLRCRFGIGDNEARTRADIAGDYNLSAVRIAQIEATAMQRLRRAVNAFGWGDHDG